jgi:photosystem II stability/assembly factor-like uncharacterized protein
MQFYKYSVMIFLVLLSAPMFAQWEHTGGPDGGFGYQIERVGQNELVAAMSYGIYRTTDNGTSWRRSGLEGRLVFRLLWVDKSQTLYAAAGDSLWFSKDRGQSWVFRSRFKGNIMSLLSVNDYIYASVQEFYDSTYGGIYRSEDEGQNFTQITTSGALTNVRAILANAQGTVLIAATYNKGVWRSTNGGSEWTLVTNGFSSTPTIWSAVYNNGRFFIGGEYLFMFSSDNGVTWKAPANKGLDTNNYFSIYTFDVLGNTIYAGETYRTTVLKSINGGNDWEHLSIPSLPEAAEVNSVNGFSANDNEWWIISDAAINYFNDTRIAWSERMDGISISQTNALAVYDNKLYGGTPRGVQSITDGKWGLDNEFFDTRWKNVAGFFQLSNAFFAYGDFIKSRTDIALRPVSISDVTLVDSIYATNGSDIYSAANNTNWLTIQPSYTFEDLSISRLFYKESTLMAAGVDYLFGTTYLLTKRNGRFVPTDSFELCYGMNTVAYKDDITFITPYAHGILSSSPSQTGWKPVNGVSEFADVTALYCDGSRLYAWIDDVSLPDDGFYYSNDLGNSWHYWGEDLPVTYAIVIHNGYVYAGTYAGVYRRPISQLDVNELPASPRLPISVAPNPASDRITVSFTIDKPELMRWKIISVDGRTFLSSRERTLYDGAVSEVLNISFLPGGKYFFILESDSKTYSTSFIKVR